MNGKNSNDVFLTDYAKKFIKYSAKQISRRTEFDRFEADDIEQDLWIAVLQNGERFDPSRASLNTFIACIVYSAAAMLIRKRKARKRQSFNNARSLERTITTREGQPEPLSGTVSESESCRRIGTEFRDEAVRRDDIEAVRAALAELPPEIEDVYRRLMNGTVASVARELGISRRCLRSLMAEATSHFEKKGFESFHFADISPSGSIRNGQQEHESCDSE